LREAAAAKYIHVACHNRFDAEDPLSSSLKLSDGDLTARDILGMSLSSELVVLSACQSGVSRTLPGDEMMGIVRALLFAGAPSIVVSLWNAYDEPTTLLMVDFYQRQARAEGSRVAALCGAQRKWYEAGARTWEWAPFILIGDWRRTQAGS
jgi:CHAT domain-containing protein